MCSHLNRLNEAILTSTHNIPFLNIKKKIILNYHKSATVGLKNEFETAALNQPSVFEPLKFYYIQCRNDNMNETHNYFTKIENRKGKLYTGLVPIILSVIQPCFSSNLY